MTKLSVGEIGAMDGEGLASRIKLEEHFAAYVGVPKYMDRENRENLRALYDERSRRHEAIRQQPRKMQYLSLDR